MGTGKRNEAMPGSPLLQHDVEEKHCGGASERKHAKSMLAKR